MVCIEVAQRCFLNLTVFVNIVLKCDQDQLYWTFNCWITSTLEETFEIRLGEWKRCWWPISKISFTTGSCQKTCCCRRNVQMLEIWLNEILKQRRVPCAWFRYGLGFCKTSVSWETFTWERKEVEEGWVYCKYPEIKLFACLHLNIGCTYRTSLMDSFHKAIIQFYVYGALFVSQHVMQGWQQLV